MGIVRESINFQRGLSDKEIRDVLFGKYTKGQILGDDVNKPFHNACNVWLYMYLGEDRELNEFKVLYIGRIQVRGGKAYINPYYLNHEGKIESKEEEYLRKLTPEEKEQTRQSFEDPKSQKHLEEVKKLSGGITPRV
jgi:hypothetical protein